MICFSEEMLTSNTYMNTWFHVLSDQKILKGIYYVHTCFYSLLTPKGKAHFEPHPKQAMY